MGHNISSQGRVEKSRSNTIDHRLENDSVVPRNVLNVLLLGTNASGKSTILTQMKIYCQNGWTNEELLTYRQVIFRNTLDSAQTIVLAMRKFDLECVNPYNRVNADRILASRIDPSPSFQISPELAEAIDQLWKDPIILQLMDHSSEFHLMDNAIYFFRNVLRIGSPSYLPTEQDILRAHAESENMTEIRIPMGIAQIRVFELGRQYSKWGRLFHCFENVTSIIFCAALSDYDQVSLTQGSQNRMAQSLLLFESVVNSRWFSRTSIILFLTKMDIFKTKLSKIPLQRYFPEYCGGTDTNKAAKYILWRFMQVNRARLSIYPHLLDATTDTTCVRLTLVALKETILQNALKSKDPLIL